MFYDKNVLVSKKFLFVSSGKFSQTRSRSGGTEQDSHDRGPPLQAETQYRQHPATQSTGTKLLDYFYFGECKHWKFSSALYITCFNNLWITFILRDVNT